MIQKFLRTNKAKILDPANRPVILKGVNLGGWLMMEGYILHSPNRAEQLFKKNFAATLGAAALATFEKDFRDHFIREKDFRAIAHHGFNCIRLPFNSRLIEKGPGRFSSTGTGYLDRAITWAKKYKIWIILDLHAASGAQNYDWHSDSLGKASLWGSKRLQDRTAKLWEFLADRYKDEVALAGYDILNEAVTQDWKALNAFYQRLIKTIRGVDGNHIIFVEGNHWAQDLDQLDDFDDDNLALSIHIYQPFEFTFNLLPHLRYPYRFQNQNADKKILRNTLAAYKKISDRRRCPIFVGEFGVNARQGNYGEDLWLKDILSCFKEFGFSWAYWTYKAVKNGILPDGVYSYYENPPWVNRAGPLTGWETYAQHWNINRVEMKRSWKTDSYRANPHILEILKNAAQ